MSVSAPPDLSGLAALAQERDLDLRPVILRVQTDLFLAAPSRDPDTLAAFEALACGLVPGIDEETAAIVARKLAPFPDTPEPVLAALARRGGAARQAVVEGALRLAPAILAAAAADGTDLAPMLAVRADLDPVLAEEMVERDDPALDLALAENAALPLSGFLRDTLVERARARADLARALLRRPELSPPEKAVLYDHADAAARAAIRAGLEPYAGLRPAGGWRADPAAAARLVAHADAADRDGFGAVLAEILGLPLPDFGFGRPERHELLALALVAAGVAEEDCVRIFLTLDPAIARSVTTVFHLAGLVRTTPPAVARHLVESVLGVAAAPRRGTRLPVMHESGAPARRDAAARPAERDQGTAARPQAEAG